MHASDASDPAAARRELDALRASVRNLEQRLADAERDLAEEQRRSTERHERLTAMRASTTFRIGATIRDASTPADWLRVPSRIRSLVREHRTTRASNA